MEMEKLLLIIDEKALVKNINIIYQAKYLIEVKIGYWLL